VFPPPWISAVLVSCIILAPDLTAQDETTVRVLLEQVPFGENVSIPPSRSYAGVIRRVDNKDGSVSIVNVVKLDDYLVGALNSEMGAGSPYEALKAQAVAARSHALYQKSISRKSGHDLVANSSQAYDGRPKLHKKLVLAVESTRGESLFHQKQPLPGYFHSSCGGHTKPVSEVWPGRVDNSSQMLTSVSCACGTQVDTAWTHRISSVQFLQSFARAGHPLLGVPKAIRISERLDGGHVSIVEIEDMKGSLYLPAEKLRSILGYRQLKSTFFTITHQPLEAGEKNGDGFVEFRGVGWGHGAGLCQKGAIQMAREGKSYRQILTHYFPGATIAVAEASRDDRRTPTGSTSTTSIDHTDRDLKSSGARRNESNSNLPPI
jgi:stage II sporulation protein D